jgi:hypothetical protein
MYDFINLAFSCQLIIILLDLSYGYAFLLPLCYMSEHAEVIRVQPHFMVQLCLDATRLRVWDACPDLFFVDSDLLFQELTNSTYDSSALILLNCWVQIISEPRSASRIL